MAVVFLSIDRRNSIFGFTPGNMYQIAWGVKKTALSSDENVLTDTTHTKRGIMLVGAETAIADVRHHAAVPDSLISFKGKGRGLL